MRWVSESSSGSLAPADTWRLRTSPRRDAGSLRTGGSGWYVGVRDPVGGPRPQAVNAECSLLWDTWHHRTLPRAGNGSGAVGRVRWALDRGGPAAQPFSAQLRITTRVLPRHSKRGYPGPGVPTVAPGPTSGEVRTRRWGHYRDVFRRNLVAPARCSIAAGVCLALPIDRLSPQHASTAY